jgi:hypothetical protein
MTEVPCTFGYRDAKANLPGRTGLTLRDVDPYGDNTVTFRVMLSGYRAAFDRFENARLSRDSAATFIPLFETLNWLVALDDQAAARWSPTGKPRGRRWWRDRVDGRHVQAIRHARNRVHHQWADALTLAEGATFPITFPLVFHEWQWRSTADLPPIGRPDREGQKAYDELLAGSPARLGLRTLTELYAQLAELLEPQLPSSASSTPTKTP